jgi:opacity protein-like surface antigen
LGGGIQYAAGTAFPAHGSRWNFTINVGLGVLIPLKPAVHLNTGIRYLHISNAGLWSENAGYDAFHLIIGIRYR